MATHGGHHQADIQALTKLCFEYSRRQLALAQHDHDPSASSILGTVAGFLLVVALGSNTMLFEGGFTSFLVLRRVTQSNEMILLSYTEQPASYFVVAILDGLLIVFEF